MPPTPPDDPTGTHIDPMGMTVDVRRVQPYEARKTYLCPGCNRDIATGTGHLVAVPLDAPDLRRDWHKGCWQHRSTRRPR